MNTAIAPPTAPPATMAAPKRPAMVAAPAPSAPRAGGSAARHDSDLDALMRRYPVGSQVRFHAYHPAIWPRDWRRVAERAAWGLRRDQLLQVTGYGAARNFPDAILTRRLDDGVEAMVFPPEVEQTA